MKDIEVESMDEMDEEDLSPKDIDQLCPVVEI
jgi:hypothetical protein